MCFYNAQPLVKRGSVIALIVSDMHIRLKPEFCFQAALPDMDVDRFARSSLVA
jgi:hypothetical protein